jgi:ABC-type glycerol-3-phosphate transport system substrate-binding protein
MRDFLHKYSSIPIVLGFVIGGSLLWMFWQTWQHAQQQSTKPSLTLSTWGTPAELQTLKGLIQDFEAQQPQIQVRVRYMPDAYTQGLQLLVASKQTPDVMMLNSLDVPRFCQADLLQNLHTVPDLDLKAYFPRALQSMDINLKEVWCKKTPPSFSFCFCKCV